MTGPNLVALADILDISAAWIVSGREARGEGAGEPVPGQLRGIPGLALAVTVLVANALGLSGADRQQRLLQEIRALLTRHRPR